MRFGILLYPLFFLSGAAGLGYQIVWVRLFAAGLGHEVPALIAVAGAFLGGMALGSWGWARRRRGLGLSMAKGPHNDEHVRSYGWLQVVIGMWGVVTAFGIEFLNRVALDLSGPSPAQGTRWAVAFGFATVALLPATAAMGATVPVMERSLGRLTKQGRAVGAFYAANTLGAAVGTLAAGFWLMPVLGFRRTLLGLASLSVLCGLGALWLSRDGSSGSARGNDASPSGSLSNRRAPSPLAARPEPVEGAQAERRPHHLGLLIFCTGWLALAGQWIGVRLLAQVVENTLYSYVAALTVYLCGTALGGAVYQRWGNRWDFRRTLCLCLGGTSLTWLVGLGSAPKLSSWYPGWRDALGQGFAGAFASEMLAAVLVFGLPTLAMGILYSHLLQEIARRQAAAGKERTGLEVGGAAALNLLGSALAIPSVAVWLLPTLGMQSCALLMAGGYLVLIGVAGTWPRGRDWIAVLVPATGVAVVLGSANLRVIELPPGTQLQEYRESAYGAVAVLRAPDGHRSLRVNNRLQMGGTAAALAERRQAHFPIILHPQPKRALFMGPGTGITLGAAAEYPGLEIDAVELVPAIVELMPAFAPENQGVFTNRMVHVMAGDARRFVRTTAHRYDVVVADLFHPAQDGAGFLYTQEHFQAIRRCLNPGGLFCQWLPLHQLGDAELKGIVRTFLATFPQSWAILLHFNADIPVLGLVGSESDDLWNIPALEARLEIPATKQTLRAVGLERLIQVLGSLTADTAALAHYAGAGQICTDDRPSILFSAPFHTAQRQVRSAQVLLEFLSAVKADRPRLAASRAGKGQDALAGQLLGFMEARDLYLQGLTEEGDGKLLAAIDLYLEASARSLHFTAAYARCVTIIQVMAQADRGRATELFRRLEAAQPAQPLGRKVLGPLLEEKP